jgi:hypothetical protein
MVLAGYLFCQTISPPTMLLSAVSFLREQRKTKATLTLSEARAAKLFISAVLRKPGTQYRLRSQRIFNANVLFVWTHTWD